MTRMKSPKGKVGRVVFLSEIMENAREQSSCCVGVEARLESLAEPRMQQEIYSPLLQRVTEGFQKLIKAG